VTIGVIIAAAGRGTRLGAAQPKPLLVLGGETLLARSLRLFLGYPGVLSIAAVVSDPALFRAALGAVDRRVRLVAGGAHRQDSVRAGLLALEPTDLVLVHDAARPLADAALVGRVVEAASRLGAAVPCIPVPDTVKRVGASGQVEETVMRETLRLAQTPQGFRTEVLRRAHDEAARSGHVATDDVGLVEKLGLPVAAVTGSRRNLKITSPGDLRVAEALLASSPGELDG
jgi:2-C-methyl-D-erythritol 4-phosphate cytidylyltransferase / 2-C-methyl-D-erythritol 2,4-cyclodiphosphate synthase